MVLSSPISGRRNSLLSATTVWLGVCDVNKALLSVHRVVQAGSRVVFASSGSYVEDETAGETMELVEKGGMYMLKLWVKAQGFSGLNVA